MSYPKLPFIILPATRLEAPGWGKLYHVFHLDSPAHYSRWDHAPSRIIRGKWHGYQLKLDLSNWSERHTYFLGRFYDLGTQLALKAVLNRGDRFVDVGANIGMITLLGAYLTGPEGRVDSFEPNPACVARIREHLELNRLEHVHIHNMALGADRQTMRLSVVTEHTGMGTLAEIPAQDRALISAEHDVQVVPGDEVLLEDEMPVRLIKMDVEGFELAALKGLSQTLERWRPAVISECVEEHLVRAGASREELLTFMTAAGYTGYAVETRRQVWRHRLELKPFALESGANNVLWLHGKDGLSSLR